jgi:plastocyanin
MVDYNQGEILKKVSFFIDAQFPALYKEYGPELVQLVKDYYTFLETDTNQSVYNIRRIFEYRDVSTTLSSMVIHWQRKYMADLPLKEDQVVFVIKNIMDLYRAKGTEQGIKLFFRVFYQEDIGVYYPAQKMFKPSDSTWRTGTFLQMFPNDGEFLSKTGVEYTYLDLLGRNIIGSTTGAKASVNKINFVLLNGILTPILYIDNLQGSFIKYDDVLCQIGGETVSFGKVNGSLNAMTMDTRWSGATTGNQVGDIYEVEGTYGYGGRAIVTGISDEITGFVEYEWVDGGFGYTVENTRLLVSDQVIILDGTSTSTEWEVGETIGDRFGNEGIVTGFNEVALGIKLNAGEEFDFDLTPELKRRSYGNTAIFYNDITNKNSSSPGILYPDGSPQIADDQVIAVIDDVETVSLITDPIAPFVTVPINSANYNAVPPAGQPMSGTADPVTLATPLNLAFDLTPFDIGRIDIFRNVDPGVNYTNDVWAIAQDSQMKQFERKDQIIQLASPAAAGSFNIDEIITEANTGIRGVVRSSNTQVGSVTFTPYAYYGFSGTNNVVRPNQQVFNILGVERDYGSRNFGDNAEIDAEVQFATGKIDEVRIFNSGFGYVNGETAYLANNSIRVAKGTITAETQGTTEGYWSNFSSHLNGYQVDSANNYAYFDSSMKLQDSDYYQEYSYEIRSMLGLETYEDFLKENMHTAGTKLFGRFYYQRQFVAGPEKRGVKQRFLRIFNDNGESTSPLDIGNTSILTSDMSNIFVDSTPITSDNDSSATNPGSYTYSITPIGGTSVDEGQTKTFNVSIPNWPNGTTIYWRIGPTPARDDDFTFQSGNVVMSNGSGGFSVQVAADALTEGTETWHVTLRVGSGSGTVVYTSPDYTINDTSLNFAPDYIIGVSTPVFDYVMTGSHRGAVFTLPAAQPPLTFNVGDKVRFVIDSGTQSSHPFYLKTSQGSGTGNQVPNVTGQGGAVLEWTAIAGVYYYQCSVHGSMNNTITVT